MLATDMPSLSEIKLVVAVGGMDNTYIHNAYT